MKLIISLFIALLISSCATRCYTVDFLDVNYTDSFNNELVIRSRGMFTKELDTTFIKNSITGITLNNIQPNDSVHFKYEIHQVEKIEKTIFLFQIIETQYNKLQVKKDRDCKYYFVKIEKINKKIELKKVVPAIECYFPIEMEEKKRLAKKLVK